MRAIGYISIFCLLMLTFMAGANAQVGRIGSGTDLYFAGTSANEHVDLDTVARLFATSDFTVEFWEKLDSATTSDSDIPFICNKDWANGANKGFVISKMSTATPSVWVNFTSASGSRFDLKNVPCPTLMTAWTHIAVSFNRNGTSPKVIVYINGVASDSGSLTTANAPTSSIVGSQHTRLAQDGTGAYSWGFKYKGYMDEVRIWKTVRTADQIRTNMCRKLTGTETNLISYYSFNDASGLVLTNRVAGAENGTLKNMAGNTEWQKSGAAIGDSSIFIYPSSWTATTLQLNSANHGKVSISNVTGPVAGMQIYRVDTVPNTYNGISNNGNNSVYYGVFMAVKPVTSMAGMPVSYDATYDYSNFSTAVTNHSSIALFNRYRNDYTTWADISATNNTASNVFSYSSLNTRRELIIGNFSTVTCTDPVNPYSDSVSATYMRVKWTGGGTQWQVQYGLQSFFLGTGTTMTINTTAVANISGLTNGAYYDVYVRKVCGAGDTSKWTGPLTVQPGYNCPVVTGVTITQLGGDSVLISWTGTGSSVYSLEWGNTGYTLGTGIPVNNIPTNSYVLHGLPTGVSLDVYIKDSCTGLSSSAWVGPTTFTNTGMGTAVAQVSTGTQHIVLYPNPASTTLNIYNTNGADEMELVVTNTIGAEVKRGNISGDRGAIYIGDLPDGMYTVSFRNGQFTETGKFIVKH